jgi:hypothetical protein
VCSGKFCLKICKASAEVCFSAQRRRSRLFSFLSRLGEYVAYCRVFSELSLNRFPFV